MSRMSGPFEVETLLCGFCKACGQKLVQISGFKGDRTYHPAVDYIEDKCVMLIAIPGTWGWPEGPSFSFDVPALAFEYDPMQPHYRYTYENKEYIGMEKWTPYIGSSGIIEYEYEITEAQGH